MQGDKWLNMTSHEILWEKRRNSENMKGTGQVGREMAHPCVGNREAVNILKYGGDMI